ncbi:MAG TPA: rhodanese-like domain-containing protein [Actinomycetota bacterium]
MNDPRELFEKQDEIQILDVREPYEWDAGHIDGSVHIPLAQVMAGQEQGRLDPERPVVIVCKSGNRSELAALMLQARGFKAENFEGGTEVWAAAGLPLLASDGSPGQVA